MSWAKYRKVQYFLFQKKKENVKIDENGNESVVTISYKIKFIDSSIFMATYIYKIEIRIRFKIKAGSYLELLTSETMKLLGSIKSKITKNGNNENRSNLEITELAVAYGSVVNNNYQQNSKVLYTFVPSKLYGRLFDISAKYFVSKNY